jgi:hypothetical protein
MVIIIKRFPRPHQGEEGETYISKKKRRFYSMTNLERLQMEIKDIVLTEAEKEVYLQENSLSPDGEYNPQSIINKRNILKTALSILESIANNPTTMKNYKKDDITISKFSENIQNRIEQLERKTRQMSINDEMSDSNYFMLFNG